MLISLCLVALLSTFSTPSQDCPMEQTADGSHAPGPLPILVPGAQWLGHKDCEGDCKSAYVRPVGSTFFIILYGMALSRCMTAVSKASEVDVRQEEGDDRGHIDQQGR